MKELIDKVSSFLNEHHCNVLTISQGSKRLAKTSEPKYAFTMADIEGIFGSLENLFKSLESQGFSNGTNVLLRRVYGVGAKASYTTMETLSLNFPAKKMTETIPTTMSVPDAQMTQPMPYAPMLGVPAMGFAQVPQMELTRYEVIKERFEDLKKENSKLEEEVKDLKSEVRNLKDENFSLRLKMDTSEEKHTLKLERELLNKKTFWESESGSTIIGALGQALPAIAERMMQAPATAVPALAMPALSEVKRQFIDIVSRPEITDEQVTEWYQLLFSENQ